MSFSRYSLCLSYLIYKRGGSNVPTSTVVKEVNGFYNSPITGNCKTPKQCWAYVQWMLAIPAVIIIIVIVIIIIFIERKFHFQRKKSALFFPYHMQPNVPFPDALSSHPKSLLSFQWRAHPSFDITESAILNRVVGEGLFEELAFEKVLRKPRKYLQKMCSRQERTSTGQELDVEVCLSCPKTAWRLAWLNMEGRSVGTDRLQQELWIYSVRDGRQSETAKQGCSRVGNRQ